MNWSVGPSFRAFTIIQAVMLFGLVWTLTFYVSPIRAAIATALIQVAAIALFGLTWPRENRIPSTAAYLLGITTGINWVILFINLSASVSAAEWFTSLVSADPGRSMFAATIIFPLIISSGWIAVVICAGVHAMVKNLPQGWRTPLWGGPDRQKVIPLRRAS